MSPRGVVCKKKPDVDPPFLVAVTVPDTMADLRLDNDLLRSLFQAQKTQALIKSSDKGMKTKKLFCADHLQETVWVRCLASLMTLVQETDTTLITVLIKNLTKTKR